MSLYEPLGAFRSLHVVPLWFTQNQLVKLERSSCSLTSREATVYKVQIIVLSVPTPPEGNVADATPLELKPRPFSWYHALKYAFSYSFIYFDNIVEFFKVQEQKIIILG